MSNESIPWFLPEVGQPELNEVKKVIESGYINDGNVAREFEAKIAHLLGVEYCIAVTSGTVAISLALMGLGIGPGDEVIVPDFTFIATANAVKMTGATVKLADIEPTFFSLCPEATRKQITPKTKAIVSVDVNGRGADYDTLQAIADEYKLILVSDSAEALGSKYNNQYLGTFGHAGCFSLSANKTITTGQGGLIVTNSSDLHDKLRELKDQGRRFTGTGGDDLHPVVGYNFKFTNLQAALGIAQLERLQPRLEHFIARNNWYHQYFTNIPDLKLPAMRTDMEEICQWTDCLSPRRDELATLCQSHGFGVRKFWHPLHTQTPYKQSAELFPNAIQVSQQGLWLPSSFQLKEHEVAQLADKLKEQF